MAALGKSSALTIAAMVVVVAVAVAFWMLLLSPKRDEAAKLGKQVDRTEESLAQHRSEVASAEAARNRFPVDYQRLVVLGKAVPASDETASLLVQLNGVADRAGVEFQSIALSAEGGGSEEAAAAPASTSGEPVSATEAAAALLPLGATIGPAGLAVMPYSLTFTGNFFQIADFIHGLDSLVRSHNEDVAVKGRLVTISAFTLTPEGEEEGAKGKGGGAPVLTASFSVTTFVTPPGQGTTAGASPSSPPEASATPASTTTGGAP